MTYKILKWPAKIFMFLLGIVLLPTIILLNLILSESFKDYCEGIDEWFTVINNAI